MRSCRPLLALVPTALLLAALTACGGTSSKCSKNSCDVTVETKGSASVKVLKSTVKFSKIGDDRLDVTEGGTTRTLREGETGRVGRFTVKVKATDPGKAKLVITR